jgi:hypothetical protein
LNIELQKALNPLDKTFGVSGNVMQATNDVEGDVYTRALITRFVNRRLAPSESKIHLMQIVVIPKAFEGAIPQPGI